MRTILNIKTAILTMTAVVAAAGFSGCGSSASSSGRDAKVKVVVAENFWGSIASQLGGDRIQQVSIITNPNTDPHDYEPTPRDSATIAQAKVVVVNGLGYDTWASKAVAANPLAGRRVVNAGDVLGLKDGDNPHRWYSPTDVSRVIDAITKTFKAVDPGGSSYYDAQRTDFDNKLSSYNSLREQIKQKYRGTQVGATESIFLPLAKDLGLDLITPEGFMNSIGEGNAPTAADKSIADEQLHNNQAKVLVLNVQNSTPDVQVLVEEANARKIPIVGVTETMVPQDTTFQAWQTQQLQWLADALAKATGR